MCFVCSFQYQEIDSDDSDIMVIEMPQPHREKLPKTKKKSNAFANFSACFTNDDNELPDLDLKPKKVSCGCLWCHVCDVLLLLGCVSLPLSSY